MEMFILVLNKTECLEPILEEMKAQGFGGGTILDSTGMMRALDSNDPDLPVLGLLRHFHNPERNRTKTLFAVIQDGEREPLLKIINDKTGGLDQPDTGIAFTVPVNYAEGLNKKK